MLNNAPTSGAVSPYRITTPSPAPRLVPKGPLSGFAPSEAAAVIDRLTSNDAEADVEPVKVVSLFSGCGGMDLGLRGDFTVFNKYYERLPFDVEWANDINDAAVRTYRKNLSDKIQCGDVWKHLSSLPEKTDVVVGGFPCQDISVNGKRAGVSGARSGLYRAMVEVVADLRPRLFVAENVKGLLMKYNADSLEKVIADFRALGYQVTYALYNACDYGVPQTRERVFIVGTDETCNPFVPPAPSTPRGTWMTAQAAIGDLEAIPENADFNHIWSRANRSAEQGSRILKRDRPGYTIRAECHGNIQFHYELPRRISMREAARFQSFPDDFIFDSRLRETERQIGNAVPPVLAWHVGRAALDCLTTTGVARPDSE